MKKLPYALARYHPLGVRRAAQWPFDWVASVIIVCQPGFALSHKCAVRSLVLTVLVMCLLVAYCHTYTDKKRCSVLNIYPHRKKREGALGAKTINYFELICFVLD